MNKAIEKTFRNARRVSAPYVALTTPDQLATARSIAELAGDVPVVAWDIARGLSSYSAMGIEGVSLMTDGNVDDAATMQNLPEVLNKARGLPTGSVLILFAANRYLDLQGVEGVAVIQAVCNLRDDFKSNRRTLVLLGADFSLPVELEQDVISLVVPYPTIEELEQTIVDTFEGIEELDAPSGDELRSHAERMRGLAPFPAETSTALAIDTKGINARELSRRAVSVINATKGLQVVENGAAFDDVAGVDIAKRHARELLAGRKKYNAVVQLDEVEKMFGNAESDLSGVGGDMLGYFLGRLDSDACDGLTFEGHPGCSKTYLAQALGELAGIPCISFDLGAMKAGLVGESGANLRNACRVIDAVTGGACLWVATCNNASRLPMALRRRLQSKGLYFFDLPTPGEQAAVFAVYAKRFEIEASEFGDDGLPVGFDCNGWTAYEIKQACELAWQLRKPLAQACASIVPVCQSDRQGVERLRLQANGSYLSANYDGLYRLPVTTTPRVTRAITPGSN